MSSVQIGGNQSIKINSMKVLHNVAFYMGITLVAAGVFGVMVILALWCDQKGTLPGLLLRELLPAISMLLGVLVGKISDEIN